MTQESVMWHVSTYIDIIRSETEFLKEESKSVDEDEDFDFPFEESFFYFGNKIPYMVGFLLF
jgi:hypothetical protein